MFCQNMTNDRISSGDCFDSFLVETHKRDTDNYDILVKQLLANNDLIIENILKWLKPSQLIKCSQVCQKWSAFVQLLRCKRKYFSHQLFYLFLSNKQTIELKDQLFMRTSLEQIIDSLDLFLSRNEINEFQIIVIFSKLELNDLRKLIQNHLLPNDCKVIHINAGTQIIGTLSHYEKSYNYLRSGLDLGGISALFMSREMPGLEVNVYKDSQIFDMKTKSNLKCILTFHIWRSFYGHFSQLKTDNDYFEHLESLVYESNDLAFGGVTVDKIALLDNYCYETKVQLLNRDTKCFLDNICCITFCGENVSAYSFVEDLNDLKAEQNLITLNNKLKSSSPSKTELIAFIFSENLKESTLKLTKIFGNIRFIGCSGVVHGSNNFSLNVNCNKKEKLFFNQKGNYSLVIICINKN